MASILESFDLLSRVILQALLNSLWPGLVFIGIVWLTMRLTGRANAATRHAIWLVSLIAVAVLPFLPASSQRRIVPSLPLAPPLERLMTALNSPTTSFAPVVSVAPVADVTPVAPVAPVAPRVRALTSAEAGPLSRGVESSVASGGSSIKPASLSADSARTPGDPEAIGRFSSRILGGPMPAVLVAVWMAISAFLCGRIAWSYFFLFRLRRRLGFVSAAQRNRARELGEVFGIRRKVRFFSSPLVGVPMTIGWLRPLLILPPDLLRTLSDTERDSILAHELAHVKRWDYVTNLLQRVAQALFFFQPAVWIIGRQLSIERELACDDWAVKMTGEPRRYANCLTRLVGILGEARPLAAATGIIFGKHVISRRIEMILNCDRNATTSVSKTTLFSAVGTAGLAVLFVSFISPVIAVPLAQNRIQARAERPRAVTPAQSPRPASAPAPVPDTAPAPRALVAVIAPDDLAEPPDFPEPPDAALAPLPDEPVFELLETVPAIAATPRAAAVPYLRAASYQEAGLFGQATTPQAPQAPRPARIATTIGGDRENSQPMIPETELLTILTDVVKRDQDPNVRAEALRGIYRVRSDAGINALLQLYDAIPDVKTRGEIVSYLMRHDGDNSKAVAKLLQIARTEKDETLRSRALSQLAKVKGDEGAAHLISIYDTLQDSKEKQTVIRYLGYNKSRKAADKLIQIAKTDTDPAVRQSAIRSLYAIDNNLYLDLREKGFGKISEFQWQPKFELQGLADHWKIEGLEHFNFDTTAIEHQREQIEHLMEQQHDAIEKAREAAEKYGLQGPDAVVTPQPKRAPRNK